MDRYWNTWTERIGGRGVSIFLLLPTLLSGERGVERGIGFQMDPAAALGSVRLEKRG